MAGHETGVLARIREKYPSAVYFHCESHRLDLVANYLNSVQEIRNTVSAIKKSFGSLEKVHCVGKQYPTFQCPVKLGGHTNIHQSGYSKKIVLRNKG
ncbi:hypothetical protein AVEN_233381-1 [Araneus ventricosus]|uniref:DUF4371 domain-containing protein n=1 Tax=Araneus ventricosus TaxID=182803 RepID=A0A4Y2MIT5_ARAVE|nr:hypothetical protein AVEN_233381-1 [Araneus ventricosus]